MPNLSIETPILAEKQQNALVEDKSAKYTLPELYRQCRELKFNKLDRGDREYFLANQGRDDCRFVNQLIKEATREAEDKFDKQPLN